MSFVERETLSKVGKGWAAMLMYMPKTEDTDRGFLQPTVVRDSTYCTE